MSDNPIQDFIDELIIPKTETAKDRSVNDVIREIERAFREQFIPTSPPGAPMSVNLWVMEIYGDYVIVCENGKYYKVGRIIDPASRSIFAGRETWTPVREEKLWIPILKEKRDAEAESLKRQD